MTRDAALAEAQYLANQLGQPVDVWEHTGGGKVSPQNRWIPRRQDQEPPQHNRWTKRETVHPHG